LPSEKSGAGYWPAVFSGLILVIFGVGQFVAATQAALSFDEAWAWDTARTHSLRDILFYEGYFRANNHLPISLWFHALGDRFAPFEWLLRIPSLMGSVFLVLGVLKIARDTLPPNARPVLLGLVLFLPESFHQNALARGYALSSAAEVWALWAAIRFALEGRRCHLLIAYGAALVAAFAILSASLFLVALLFWLVFLQLVYPWRSAEERPPLLRRLAQGLFWPEFAIAGLILFYLYPVGSGVAASDEAIPGAQSFIFGTFASMLTSILGQELYLAPFRIFLKLVLCALTAGMFLVGLSRTWENSRFLVRPAGTVTMLSLLMVGALYLLFFLQGTPFPMVRTALFLLLPLVMALVMLGASEFPRRWTCRLTATAVCLLLLFLNGSLDRLRFVLAPGPREVLQTVQEDLPPEHRDGAGFSLFYERTGPPWDFYAERLGLTALDRTGRWQPWPMDRLVEREFDYLFVNSREALELIWRGPEDLDYWNLMSTADNRHFLLRRRVKLPSTRD
jgi:hypothetical protein